MTHTYPDLAKMAPKALFHLHQPTSVRQLFKTKCRNRLDVTNDMRVVLFKVQPKINELIEVKQVHPISLNFFMYFFIKIHAVVKASNFNKLKVILIRITS